jgi:hypothetical protein
MRSARGIGDKDQVVDIQPYSRRYAGGYPNQFVANFPTTEVLPSGRRVRE